MSQAPIIGSVLAVLTGKAAPFVRPGAVSAIAKQPASGRVYAGELGLDGDEQGDPRFHGGPHKALHLYAFEHYARWREDIGARPVLRQPGAFGENISTLGVDESTLCLGDQLAIGAAVLEISQGRQPCWKLNHRLDQRDMAKRLQDSGRTGWYCRVLQSGEIGAGDDIRLQARPHPEWSLARLAEVFYQRGLERELLLEAAKLPLVESWRTLIEKRLESGQLEDWSRRLEG
ncbi:MOSC domain-containing protein [Chromobacterium sp. IIBBL 290-4]|uniref:MOSC domain-containing protein n=1 Tax=Chromobacterium sp. IIBBL 290-4 TaxID=2953890 RepID=UPI0020B6873C|nr:MOSC domain-containing protein [Chromobacterium sp. IIBBL 290-4]UTH72347.1 MOSC domain-containing protein [Chromobacterium sp. IIBBL 290-4]